MMAIQTKFLIVGLGNPGEEYAHTRHNIGFDVVDAFARDHGIIFHPGRLADTAVHRGAGREYLLIKPTTYVNLSGRAVRYWLDKEKIPLENLLVVLDDLALPLNALRLKPGGSDGGHNGLKSIQESLGTGSYSRLRFGIGRDYPRGRQVDHVLGKWKPQELPVVARKTQQAVLSIQEFVLVSVQQAMNGLNHLVFD